MTGSGVYQKVMGTTEGYALMRAFAMRDGALNIIRELLARMRI